MAMLSTKFSVDSDLLLELGERLVASKSTALAELVKNAYDADAVNVEIRLENVTRIGGTITVKDDGHGMDGETVEHAWMRIATNQKKRRIISRKYKRIVTGSKGIGRFACRVLSDTLILETAGVDETRKVREKTRLTINWSDFSSGTELSEVPISYERVAVFSSTPTGTLITLKNARESWQESDIIELKNRLLTLISPFPEAKKAQNAKSAIDPGLKISLEVPEFRISGLIGEEEYLQYAYGRLRGKVSSDGSVSYSFHIRHSGETVHYSPKKLFRTLGPCDYVLDFFVYSGVYFRGIPVKVVDARRRGEEKGGVRIYLDRFRIPPYGERRDDWLSLDEERGRRLTEFEFYKEIPENLERPALLRPGNNQVFGVVNLSRVNNPNIQPSIAREKLLENEAFKELRECVKTGIEWMTIQYARSREEVKKEPKADPLTPLLNAKKMIMGNENIDQRVRNEVAVELDTTIDLVKNFLEEQISETSMLRVLASTGTMINVFQHEIAAMVTEIIDVNEKLKRISLSLDQEKRSAIGEQIAKIESWIGIVEGYAQQIGVLIGKDSRDTRKTMSLYYIAERLEDVFGTHLADYHIEFDHSQIGKNIFLPRMFNCEAYALFLNIFSNAVKAVKKVEDRRIKMVVENRDSNVIVRLLDSGVGVSRERRLELFRPFVSDSEPDPFFGQGTGLGLTIVKNIVETYGGKVAFVDPPVGWRTCLEIVFSEGFDDES